MNKFISWIALGLGAIALVVSLSVVGGNSQPQEDQVGASGTRFPNGISADTTSPVAGELRGADLTLTDDATIAGRSLIVTTSNLSTSTTQLGCIQTTATSTATPIYLTFSPYVGTTTTQGGTSNFLVAARFGSCPI